MEKNMKELVAITTELKAPKRLKNTFGGFNYRDASGILEALKPLLEKYQCTLHITSEMQMYGNRYYVVSTATLTNKEGQCVEASAPAREEESKKGMDAAQLSGACVSYSKKYALCNLFCIDDSTLDPDTDKATSLGRGVEKGKANKEDKAFVESYINAGQGWPEWLLWKMSKEPKDYDAEDWTLAAKAIKEYTNLQTTQQAK